MLKIVFLLGLFIIQGAVIAQNTPFLVEIEPFAPGTQEMIEMMEGNPAEPFDAVDVHGNRHTMDQYAGENLLFWFWATDDKLSTGLIEGLNLMHKIFNKEVTMLGFAYDHETVVKNFLLTNQIAFHIIPNSVRTGELLYGSELGLGRIFLIDKQGMVKKAIPRDFFIDNQHSFNQLRSQIQQLIDE